MKHLLAHFGIEPQPQFRPHWPENPPGDRPLRVDQDLIAEFARYFNGNGRDWRGLEFDGMASAPMDAEGARLAGILERIDQRRRWKIRNHAVRMVGGR